jgi:hypothetical protein
MSRIRLVTTALLAANVAAHVVAYRQAQRAGASARDTFGMLGGAGMYAALAVGVTAGNSAAVREAARAPVGGIVALLATWKQSGIPAATRQAIIGIDLALVATGFAARRESTTTQQIAAP